MPNPYDYANVPGLTTWFDPSNSCYDTTSPNRADDGTEYHSTGAERLTSLLWDNSEPVNVAIRRAIKMALMTSPITIYLTSEVEQPEHNFNPTIIGCGSGGGDHTVTIVGWDDNAGVYLVANSHGEQGVAHLPFGQCQVEEGDTSPFLITVKDIMVTIDGSRIDTHGRALTLDSDGDGVDTICNKDLTTDIALYEGTLAASGMLSKKVRLFDVSQGTSTLLSEYQASGKVADIKVYDGRLHLLLNDGSASVVDIRTPASPVAAGTYSGNDDTFTLKISGKYAVKKDKNNMAVYQFDPI